VKTAFVLVVAAIAGVVFLGSPLTQPTEQPAHLYGSETPILPMSFAHADHENETCVTCHHNFADDTGHGFCMNCHVTQPDLAPLLEAQFHDLCRGCHLEKRLDSEDSGPLRACSGCHIAESDP